MIPVALRRSHRANHALYSGIFARCFASCRWFGGEARAPEKPHLRYEAINTSQVSAFSELPKTLTFRSKGQAAKPYWAGHRLPETDDSRKLSPFGCANDLDTQVRRRSTRFDSEGLVGSESCDCMNGEAVW